MYLSRIEVEYSPASCVRLAEGNNGQDYVTMGIYCDGLKWNDDSIDKEGPNFRISIWVFPEKWCYPHFTPQVLIIFREAS